MQRMNYYLTESVVVVYEETLEGYEKGSLVSYRILEGRTVFYYPAALYEREYRQRELVKTFKVFSELLTVEFLKKLQEFSEKCRENKWS